MLVNGNFCVGSCLSVYLHMAVKLSRHQYAFSYHRVGEIYYKSVSHIPVYPRLAAKVWLVWLWPYECEIRYSTAPRSHISKGLAIL